MKMVDRFGNMSSKPKKRRRKKNKKLPEPLTPNERANVQIKEQIDQKINRSRIQIKKSSVIPLNYKETTRDSERFLSTKNDDQFTEEISDETDTILSTPNPYSFSVMIPEFLTSKTDYSANHGCRKLNRLYCDNSQNFISQCGVSANTNCQMLDMIVDCRKVMAYNFYLKGVGNEYVKYSMFGPSSKCVRIKEGKRKSAVCLGVQCDPTGNSYWIIFPNDIGRNYLPSILEDSYYFLRLIM